MRIQSKFRPLVITTLFAALLAANPAAAQCDNGREGILSDLAVSANALEWRLLAEHRAVTLTVSAPCGLVVERTYEEGKNPYFDLKEIPADPDGVYSWQLRITPHVDPEVEQALKKARETGKDQTIEYELRQKGMLPEGPFLQTGAFTVFRGSIVPPDTKEEESSGGKLSAGVRPASSAADSCPFTGAVPAVDSSRLASIAPAVDRGGSNRPMVLAAAETPRKIAAPDFLINDDLIVIGSACVGFDCVNGEVFSFDTIRLKENNLRIKFDDTSTAASFPRNDWEIEINSSTNGGQSYFRIKDVTGNRSPFTIEAAAPSHSLYVDNTGRIGRRTANPILDLHIVDGDTPGIRLDQDGSSGFAAQVWDIAGNETNFFVRDVNAGSTLPFRIFPGSPSSSLVVRNGNVGVGLATPSQSLHVRRTDGTAQVFVQEASATSAQRTLLRLENNGAPAFSFQNNAATGSWSFFHANNDRFVISRDGSGTQEFAVAANGDILVGGSVVHTSSRDSKADFEQADPEELLARLSAMPILEWRYKSDDEGVRHLGPIAEDFHAAFGLGTDDRTIALNDSIGVALGSIQALQRQAESLRRENEGLTSRLEMLEGLVQSLASDR